MKLSKKITFASLFGLGLLFNGALQADTVYDMTFTDSSRNPYFSNATGTFSINSSDQVTSFDVSFTMLQPYTFDGTHLTTGEVLDFNTSTLYPAPVYYHPATNSFTESGLILAGNVQGFQLYSLQGATTEGATLVIVNNTGSLVNNAYDLTAVDGESYPGFIDSGLWTISAAPVTTPVNPATAPEPATVGFLLSGLLLCGSLIRRRKRA
jgi:hypothetical protein